MKNKSLDDLMKIIGSNRSDYSDDVIREAEAEIKNRTSNETGDFIGRIRKYGRIVAFIGGVMLLWAVLVLIMSFGHLSGKPIPDENASFMARNFSVIFYMAGTLQIIIGGMLFVGGLAFRAQKEWGRKLLLIIIGIGIFYIIGFLIFWEIMLISIAGLDGHTIAMAIGGLIISSLFLMMLWMPFKYFKSKRVKDACM